MSLLLLLNPKQYGGVTETPDTSDILDVYRKRRKKREDELLEEEIAAQLLKARQTDVSIPANVDVIKLGAILREKLYENIKPDEVQGLERTKRIKLLLLALVMDD
jgi:hypothetical protein